MNRIFLFHLSLYVILSVFPFVNVKSINNNFVFHESWIFSTYTNNFDPIDLGGSSLVRGMDTWNGKIYFPLRGTVGNHKILIYSGESGEKMCTLALQKDIFTKIEGGDTVNAVTLPNNDLHFDNVGNCLIGGCVISTNEDVQPMLIYKVNLETGSCDEIINEPIIDNVRFDAFDVYGDVNNDAVIMAIDNNSLYCYRWVINNGVVGKAEKILLPKIYGPSWNYVLSARMHIINDSIFYVDGHGSYANRYKYTEYGVEYLDNSENTPYVGADNSNLAGCTEFQLKDKNGKEQYFFISAKTNGDDGGYTYYYDLIQFADEKKNFAEATYLCSFPENTSKKNSNTYRTAEVSVEIVGNVANIYIYIGENCYAKYQLEYNVIDTIYFKPNSNWNNQARFAMYCWDEKGAEWFNMSDLDGDGIYLAEKPKKYKNVIFCRMNQDSPINDWSNKFNQTADLIYDGIHNFYVLEDDTWNGEGLWSIFIPNSIVFTEDVVLSFDNKITNRIEFSTNRQVWVDDKTTPKLTFINEKGISMSDIAEYEKPIRCYKGSNITIETVSNYIITKMIVFCNNTTYASVLKESVGEEAILNSQNVTIFPTKPTQAYTITSLTAQIQVDSIIVTLDEVDVEAEIVRPTASVLGGEKYEAFDVKLECLTTEAKIYYILNGGEKTEYNKVINIAETTELKVWAEKETSVSDTLTINYIFPINVANIAELVKDKSNTNIRIEGAVTVFAQVDKYLWVKDESMSILIYGDAPKYNNGDQLVGFVGKLSMFNGTPEISPVYFPNAVSGVEVEPKIMALTDVTEEFVHQYIKLENVTYIDAETLTLGDKTLVMYNRFGYTYDGVNGDKVDVVAIVGLYNEIVQIYPVSIVKVENLDFMDVYVTGSESLCGSFWMLEDLNNKMDFVDGLYVKTYGLPIGDYEFKITFGSSWDGSRGSMYIDREKSTPGFVANISSDNNIGFSLPQFTTVTISYDKDNDKIILVADEIEQFGKFTIESYTLCGSSAIFGEDNNPSLEENDMTENNNIWIKTYENIYLSSGTYYYKVAANHAWNQGQYPADANILSFNIDKDATYNLNFTYNPNAQNDNLTINIQEVEGDDFITNLELANSENWNNINKVHNLSIKGLFKPVIKEKGVIEYKMGYDSEWHTFTDTLSNGEEFTEIITPVFRAGHENHTIQFRIKNKNNHILILPSLDFLDISFSQISGISDRIYSGDSLFQENLTCSLDKEKYIITNYVNNVNAGIAYFDIEGVFPYSIGKKTYSFIIEPTNLVGSIEIVDSTFIYNGKEQAPSWFFTNNIYNTTLKLSADYSIDCSDAIYPGNAILKVVGCGNYKGVLTTSFEIAKAPLSNDLYDIILPNKDITYDTKPHEVAIIIQDGVGEPIIYYQKEGEDNLISDPPSNSGKYNVYISFSEGEYYLGFDPKFVDSFTIYDFAENDWNILQDIHAKLSTMNWLNPWDIEAGIFNVASFDGLSIEKGHVVSIDLNSNGLSGIFPCEILSLPEIRSINLSNNSLNEDLGDLFNRILLKSYHLENIINLDISNNEFYGNVSDFANSFENLIYFNATKNKIKDVNSIISSTILDLNLSHQEIDDIVEIDLSIIDDYAFLSSIPSVLLYNHQMQDYISSVHFLCVDSNNWQASLYLENENSLFCPLGDFEYKQESGSTIELFLLDETGNKEGSSFKISACFNPGDVNFVSGVDATDLQSIILYMFGEYNNRPFNLVAADLYKDNIINVQDIICVVDLLLKEEVKNANMKNVKSNVIDNIISDVELYVENGFIKLRTQKSISALSIMYEGNILWDFSAFDLEERNIEGALVGYSLFGNVIPEGEHIIGKYTGDISINNISLADPNANAISVKVSINKTITTNNEFLNSEDDTFIGIYDITGKKLNGIIDGINIIKYKNKTIKILNNK